MKKPIVYLLMFLLPLSIFSQTYDSIYAEVDSNYVTLWQTGAFRNCGAEYNMNVTEDGFSLNWYQENVGYYAYCTCNFDLSVTTGPLLQGNYTANVYVRELYGDTTYQGTTTFTIEQQNQPGTMEIVEEFQSECGGTVNIYENPENELSLKVFPNPAQNDVSIAMKTNRFSRLYVYNSFGEIVNSFPIEKEMQTINWNLTNGQGSKLLPGYYLIKMITVEGVRVEKLVIL